MLPPGPPTPALWQTYRFVSDPRGYSKKILARYGGVSRFRALNTDGVVVSDPQVARQVFATAPDAFETPSVLGDVFGVLSVLATSGDTHKRQRKLLNPQFHGAQIRAFAGAMQAVVLEHGTALEDAAKTGEIVVMTDLAQALTLDVILETAFGTSEDLDRAEARRVMLGIVRTLSPAAVFSRILRNSFFPPWRRFLAARAAFDAWIDGLVAKRRARATSGTDLLGLLVDVRYDDGGGMADAEIRDQLIALLVAGHETTAVALAWGVYWLCREPAVLTRLREELDSLDADAAPEAIGRLPYLQAVISEILRIEPIVSDVPRVCKKDYVLGDFTVPAGETVVVNIAAILSREDLFPEPERFRPERFLDRTFTGGEFMPFGGGHRRCLGAAFAEMELAIALATIARTWDLVLADSAPEKATRRNITMGPTRGVRVRVQRRASSV